ncbi:MAG TPA: hypothetical protein VFE47_17990 [Tepidisphaeraceae bacterium]|jgi:hypothetical protein|nr:hypothetical protein [Tepidisphaeraceae bacterium]
MPESERFRAALHPANAGLDRSTFRSDDNYRTHGTESTIYRDQARHLRQLFAGDSQRLHQSLCALSRRYDRNRPAAPIGSLRPHIMDEPRPQAQTPGRDWARSRPQLRVDLPSSGIAARVTPRIYTVPTSESPDSPFARAVVDWFADQVARQFTGKLLLGAQRKALLKTADRLGIDRFHANLIIAVAQHEANQRSNGTVTTDPSKRHFSVAAMAMVGLIQSLIIWGAWHVLHMG